MDENITLKIHLLDQPNLKSKSIQPKSYCNNPSIR